MAETTRSEIPENLSKAGVLKKLCAELDSVVRHLQDIDAANHRFLQFDGEKNNFGAGFSLQKARRILAEAEAAGIQIEVSELLPDVPSAHNKNIHGILAGLEKAFFTEVARDYRGNLDLSRRLSSEDKERWSKQERWNKQQVRELIAAIYPDFFDDTGKQKMVFDPYKKHHTFIQDSMWADMQDENPKDSLPSWIA
ncbi:MAG: hypothetical protein WC304_02785 [Candidatus Gracilibacteria bacterium]|jgi:hypothetical protein